MRGVRGFLTGALVLITLEIVVTNKAATGRVSGLFSGIAHATSWLVDNTTPGIPDRKHPSATSSPFPAAPISLISPPPVGTTTAAYSSPGVLA